MAATLEKPNLPVPLLLKMSGTGQFGYSSVAAILASRPVPHLFPCSSIDWTTVFCIGEDTPELDQVKRGNIEVTGEETDQGYKGPLNIKEKKNHNETKAK